MLLVHPEFRGGGIGKALLMRAVEHLQSEKIASIKLDATPLGEELYRKMGFKDEWSLTRYKGIITGNIDERPGKVQNLTARHTAGAIELDAEAFGVQRKGLLPLLVSSAEHTVALKEHGGFQAFGLVR